MGAFSELAGALLEGVLLTVAENGLPKFGGHAGGRIDRLCAELGWAVDERAGNAIRLHFRNSSGGVRVVSVCNGDDDLALFITSSNAIVQTVPAQVAEHLVTRHLDIPFGAWSVTQVSGGVGFALIYKALGDALTAAAFKAICESMVTEAVEFDDRMRAARLLS